MNIADIGVLLEKIQRLQQQFSQQKQSISALERDVLLQHIRHLYESCLWLDTASVLQDSIPVLPIQEPAKEQIVAPPVQEVIAPVREETPVVVEKKFSFTYTQPIAEITQSEKTEHVEEVKKEEKTVEIPVQKEPEAKQEERVIRIIRQEPEVQIAPVVLPKVELEIVPPVVETPVTPPVEVQNIVPPVVETPVTPPVALQNIVPPVVETPVTPPVALQNIVPPVVEMPPVLPPPLPKAEVNPEYDELFTFPVAVDISQKLSERPIADLDSAIAIGDKFMYINQLFNGNAAAFKACGLELRKAENLQQARLILEYTHIPEFKWMDKNRKATAKEFMKLVRRLYLKP